MHWRNLIQRRTLFLLSQLFRIARYLPDWIGKGNAHIKYFISHAEIILFVKSSYESFEASLVARLAPFWDITLFDKCELIYEMPSWSEKTSLNPDRSLLSPAALQRSPEGAERLSLSTPSIRFPLMFPLLSLLSRYVPSFISTIWTDWCSSLLSWWCLTSIKMDMMCSDSSFYATTSRNAA